MRKKKKQPKATLPLFDKIILGLNAVCVLCLLLSYLAPGSDPRDYTWIAILGFAYLPIVAANLVFVIYWAIRKRLFFLISGVAILLGFNVILSFFQFSTGNKPGKVKPAKSLRMMAYNVRGFKGIDRFAELPIQSEVYKLIAEQQPDIVNIEEYDARPAEKGLTADSIRKTLKTTYSFFKPFQTNPEDSSGNAIFSKYPIIDTGSIPSPAMLLTRTIYADIKYGNDTIRVYCIHLAAVTIKGGEKSKYLKGGVSLGSSAFIGNKLSSAFVARSLQVSRIKSHIEKCRYPYILAGDFNDTPNSFSVNELGDGLKNAFREQGSGFQTTYYSSFPLHIDHLFVSPQFDILNYQAVDKKVSDHKPIISDLRLN